MRALTWFEVGTGATQAEVRQLEEDFAYRLPLDVIAFLSTHAGASNPDESEFDIVELSGRRRVGKFGYALSLSGEHADSIRTTARVTEGLPTALIPIVGTGSGDYVCLDVRRGSAGAVVYYMHERPAGDCVVPLATSLTEFLEMLRCPDE